MQTTPRTLPPRGTVADILATKGRIVHGIAPEATVFEVVAAMDARGIGALLIFDGERLAGIVSERDYTRKVILRGRSSRETKVAEIMTTPVVTVTPETSLGECMNIVNTRKFRHLPVVEGGRVIGVVSIGDLVRAVIDQQAEQIQNLASYIGSDYPR